MKRLDISRSRSHRYTAAHLPEYFQINVSQEGEAYDRPWYNGISPVIAKLIWGNVYAWPIDSNARFIDGRPLLGASKTVRGVVASLVITALGAWLLGLGMRIGLLVAAAAMAGDLISSFVKRRLDLSASSKATRLDQVPESLLPLLACRSTLSLSAIDIAAGCTLFFVGEVLLSRVLYHLRLRDRPY